MGYKIIFAERLSELMFYTDNISAKNLAKKIDVTPYAVRSWKNGSKGISLFSAIKLVDYFHCSLDFLFGRCDKELDFKITTSKPFYACLISYMKENEISRYSIVQNTNLSNGNFYSWRKGGDPKMQSVIDLANYFKCSLDNLVGRDR